VVTIIAIYPRAVESEEENSDVFVYSSLSTIWRDA